LRPFETDVSVFFIIKDTNDLDKEMFIALK